MKLPETLAEEIRNANRTDKLDANQLQSICEGVVDNWADELLMVAESQATQATRSKNSQKL